MKSIFKAWCMAFTTLAVLSSCLNSSDSELTLYEDTAITGITLGTLNRYTEAVSTNTGNDTIVKSTLTGSVYKLTIDQLGHSIYNQTPLPVGTDLAHVTLNNIATKNGGAVYVKSLTSDTLAYLSTTDSIDFRQPRTLRVYASDGSGSRDYTMTLTASETTGVVFEWRKVLESDELTGWSDMQLVAFRDTVYLMEKGIVIVGDDNSAKAIRVSEAGYVEAQDFIDGDDWKPLEGIQENPGLAMLIGSTEHELFALGKDGRLKVSVDGMGRYWRDEQLDSDAALLPTTNIDMVSWEYAPVDSMEYILMVGCSEADDSNCVLWRKLTRYHAPGEETEGQWVYMPVDANNRYALPRQEGLSVVRYNGSLLAMGSLLQLLQSRDQGITWKKNGTYTLPTGVKGTQMAMITDGTEQLWLVTNGGQVWHGKLR